MKFVCMGFISESKLQSLSAEEGQRMMDRCFAYDDELRRGGHFLGGEALQSTMNAVTLRTKNGSVDVTDGPYAETKEMLGGILLLEARDMDHAVALMSQHPGVKMGPFEIRPADEQVNALIATRDEAVRAETPQRDETIHSKATLQEALMFSFDWIKPLADDLADVPMTSPTPTPGNHPLWIMGHLTYSNAGLLAMISGNASPYENWSDIFAGGTLPLSDVANYPSYTEVVDAFDVTHRSTLRLLKQIADSRLADRPIAVPDALRDDPSFQTIGKVFLFIAMHAMSHRGQLADARQAAGRKPFA
ncbi:YciI family protein [Allorhodopirellula heiligendammensis]|uniref:YCII-related domain protein n=1 Tax=Allorhodopirellula heiligendammensis TaxID=2714739 RepID=A0A5C6BV10_9BACT|nr:YciI family protein [Allorhodopirellula heiligendammensis]TWU15487.1 YCII-related domain protein [Allorhodopirellula heiligendammensis]